jgi:CBS domain-containing protein
MNPIFSAQEGTGSDMTLPYRVIEIFTNEEARWAGKPLSNAIVDYVRRLKIAARCIVTRGIEGSYENGEIAAQNIEVLSFNMPLKIEIVLPSSELDLVLQKIEEMVSEGIIAVREMEIHAHKTQQRLLPRQIRVKDIMTPSPRKVTASTPLNEVARLLLSSNFTGVPVVDREARPMGIITQGDLVYRAGIPMRLGLLAASEREKLDSVLESLASRKAEEIMSSPAVSIKEDEPATEAVNLMMRRKLKRLPVVNKKGSLTGIVSRLDIFRTIMKESPNWKAFQGGAIEVGHRLLVSDIMRRDTYAVSPETSLEEVIGIIDSNDIQRVAVVDRDGTFLGLISDRDLLTAFADHHPGIWDFFMSKVPFTERGRRQKEVREQLRGRTAAEAMKTDLITVTEDTSLDEAIKLMTEKALKRLPVLDPEGKFKGMISRDALLRTGFGQH